MKRRYVAAAIAGSLLILGSTQAAGAGAGTDGHNRDPRNVIYLIGDGMGVQEITAARYYLGVHNKLNVDRMQYTGFDTTWSIKPAAAPPYLPDYDPDSAATATMWATGTKTIDERLSQGPSTALNVPGNNNIRTVLEIAQRKGMKVGNVSTADLTDATPASLASHISQRGCQGPANMANCGSETKAAGGLGSIAEQEVDHRIDVLLGGGRARFEQTITGGPDTGKTVVQSAQAKGIKYVTDAAGLAGVRSGPVLGAFNASNMSLEWSGPASSLGKGNTPVPCTEGQRPANEPSLADMTTKALSLLENRKGFFLQVEGASIDKQDHATNACGQIGETVAFDKAVGVALDYQRHHPNTLVVVSADHSQASQIVAEDVTGSDLPTGYSTNLITRDGQTLTMHYGTAGFGGAGNPPVATPPSQQHTGAVVAVWANGPGGAAVLGTNDHTDLFHVLGG